MKALTVSRVTPLYNEVKRNALQRYALGARHESGALLPDVEPMHHAADCHYLQFFVRRPATPIGNRPQYAILPSWLCGPPMVMKTNGSTVSKMGVSLAKGAPITNRRQDAILPHIGSATCLWQQGHPRTPYARITIDFQNGQSRCHFHVVHPHGIASNF